MKKAMMVLVTAAMAATVAVADVESKNVVGFSSRSLSSNKYTSIGWQFALVGGASNTPIAAITNYVNADTGNSFNFADGIRTWVATSASWQIYYRHANGWRRSGESITTADVLKTGEMALFFKRTDPSSLVQSGEVISDDVFISVPTNLYTAIANPFPVSIPIAAITNYVNEDTGNSFNFADGIRKWVSSNETWQLYYRHSTGWRRSGESTTTADEIDVGEGFFFFKRTDPTSIKFTSPL